MMTVLRTFDRNELGKSLIAIKIAEIRVTIGKILINSNLLCQQDLLPTSHFFDQALLKYTNVSQVFTPI